jgi:hypothetical protein
VPAYAAWFRYDRLHAQEVRGLPEYFKEASPTKSPRVSAPRAHCTLAASTVLRPCCGGCLRAAAMEPEWITKDLHCR